MLACTTVLKCKGRLSIHNIQMVQIAPRHVLHVLYVLYARVFVCTTLSGNLGPFRCKIFTGKRSLRFRTVVCWCCMCCMRCMRICLYSMHHSLGEFEGPFRWKSARLCCLGCLQKHTRGISSGIYRTRYFCGFSKQSIQIADAAVSSVRRPYIHSKLLRVL